MRKGITCFGMPVTVGRATDVLRPCGCRSRSRLVGSSGARPAPRRPAVAGAPDPALPAGPPAPPPPRRATGPLPPPRPRTFTEKLNWRITLDRRELLAPTCDKLAMKEHART